VAYFEIVKGGSPLLKFKCSLMSVLDKNLSHFLFGYSYECSSVPAGTRPHKYTSADPITSATLRLC